MAVDGSALVLVRPDDTIDSIAKKVRGTGASSVQLLVPDHTAALQALSGFERLRASLGRDHIDLMIISSDEKTLNAARLNHLDTIGVQGVRVTLPPDVDQSNPYATQVLRTPDAGPRRTAAIPPRDAEFLDALDQVPAKNRYADEKDTDLYAALDDLSDAIEYSATTDRGGRSTDEDFAAALDEWSEATDEGRPSRRSFADDLDTTFDAETAPRRRVRPEDIEVSPDELRGQRRKRPRAEPQATASSRARRRVPADRMLDLEEYEEFAPRRGLLRRLLPLIILLLLILAAVLWYRNARATIEITPAIIEQSYNDEAIPLSTGDDEAGRAVIQGQPVNAEATFAVRGQVLSETLSPVGRANGAVTIINTVEQPLPLPEGTEFLGTNANGQEVRFAVNAPITIPPAVTTSSLTGRSTSYGQIDVPITARSPGSASNVGENTIKQILIPGQQPITTDTGNFLLRHGPISGGDEQQVRIVTQADVDRVLGEALSGLYNAGQEALRSQIDETTTIDETTINPNPEELADPTNYEEPLVEPPIGQAVDPNNPTFTVTVRTRFNALATPRDNPLQRQLETVVLSHIIATKFQGALPCNENELGMEVASPRWDGSRFTVDAVLRCTPRGEVSPDLRSRVKSAVLGQSREAADASLRELKNLGKITSYTLPEGRDSFPSFDFLIDVVPAPTTAPAEGAP